MSDFGIRFLSCNLWICLLIGILFILRHLFRGCLTSRMRYRLWLLLPVFLAVPFLPLGFIRLPQLSALVRIWSSFPVSDRIRSGEPIPASSAVADWMNDFGISISRNTPSGLGFFFCCLWIAGILVMTAATVRAMLHLYHLRQSALPLQNAAIRRLYNDCLHEMQIQKNIPVYSTAFLNSPVITGCFRPCIYLPIRLIADYDARQIRYMLLHELQHYRHKDTLVHTLLYPAGILYWFNPFVWFALKEMRADREAACDASVLEMLHEEFYEDYGNTLLDLAQNVSEASFPFAAGLSGSMAQMKKRILHIAGYHSLTRKQKLQGTLACLLTTVILSGFLPLLSAQGSDSSRYAFYEADKTIIPLDLTKEFGLSSGSFVLYDTANDSWQIYQKEHALTRTAPASTYKIYSALLGLETGAITPEQSVIRWNGQKYQYDTWNADQDLTSAMLNSVNWYFQTMDARIGLSRIKSYIHDIGYGNQTIAGDTATYWMNDALKISPVEQVEMLRKFHDNSFGFAPEHITSVKQSLRLESNENGTLYGKTGTISVHGKTTSGWLIGFVEKDERTCYFAINIQGQNQADGFAASQLALRILSRLHIWSAK